MNNKRRVVITGMGVVSPIGIGLQDYWQGLIKGETELILLLISILQNSIQNLLLR